MPAPKGNKNAVKDNPKSVGYHIKMRPETLEALKKVAKQEKISMVQVIEKSLLKSHPKEFDGKF